MVAMSLDPHFSTTTINNSHHLLLLCSGWAYGRWNQVVHTACLLIASLATLFKTYSNTKAMGSVASWGGVRGSIT